MAKWNNPIVVRFLEYMGGNPISALKKEANYLLKSTDQLTSSTNFKWIDVDKIAVFLNLKHENYIYSDKISSAGYITESDAHNAEIELNLDKTTFAYYKHRFVIAHEIGHWIIRSKISNTFSEKEINLIKKNKFEEELLCHLFASELLMPEEVFNAHIENDVFNENLIARLYRIFKVPDYQIIHRFLLLNPESIGIYWKKKVSENSSNNELRVLNFYPDNKIKENPFIPINATAKDGRFVPNLITKSFNQKMSVKGKIFIKDFGEINGNYEIFVFNPVKKDTFFEETEHSRKFDLITILKKL